MIHAIGASPGIGIAPAMIWRSPINFNAIPQATPSPEQDKKRFLNALQLVTSQNKNWYNEAKRRIGQSEADIFDVHIQLLQDNENIVHPISRFITEESFSAEYSVLRCFNSLAANFLALEDEYMRQRADDLYNLRDQLLHQMLELPDIPSVHFTEPTIVLANSISPGELINLDLTQLEGIISESDGYTSHTAIMARTLGIPAVVGAQRILDLATANTYVALDGETGEVWISPAEKEIQLLLAKDATYKKQRRNDSLWRGRPTVTTDGRRIKLSANMSSIDELDTVLGSDAEAIGLFRTEVLHLNRNTLPSEDEQFEIYKNLIARLNGKAACVRTLDSYLDNKLVPPEKQAINPSMGYRGIRMSLRRPSLFRTQLRALLRASAYGGIKILLPMITFPHELDEALAAIESVKEELRRENTPFNENVAIGILLGVPSTAFSAGLMASKVDFIEIAINDLTQFTLAIDRANSPISDLFQTSHCSVLNLIKMIVDAANQNNIPCHICGDIPPRAETSLPALLGLGISGFSINPSFILAARRILNNCNYEECQIFSQKMLTLHYDADMKQAINKWKAEHPLPNM